MSSSHIQLLYNMLPVKIKGNLHSPTVQIVNTIVARRIYRFGQNQLDDLNLAPCRHLCRWRGETRIAG